MFSHRILWLQMVVYLFTTLLKTIQIRLNIILIYNSNKKYLISWIIWINVHINSSMIYRGFIYFRIFLILFLCCIYCSFMIRILVTIIRALTKSCLCCSINRNNLLSLLRASAYQLIEKEKELIWSQLTNCRETHQKCNSVISILAAAPTTTTFSSQ